LTETSDIGKRENPDLQGRSHPCSIRYWFCKRSR
jgi:hypothetical protein